MDISPKVVFDLIEFFINKQPSLSKIILFTCTGAKQMPLIMHQISFHKWSRCCGSLQNAKLPFRMFAKRNHETPAKQLVTSPQPVIIRAASAPVAQMDRARVS
jgi:hypothetical protein